MSDIRRKAAMARELADNAAFLDIVAEIRDAAGNVFYNPSSSLDQLAAAHASIRAIETFTGAIQSRIDAQSVLDKQEERDRARHDR